MFYNNQPMPTKIPTLMIRRILDSGYTIDDIIFALNEVLDSETDAIVYFANFYFMLEDMRSEFEPVSSQESDHFNDLVDFLSDVFNDEELLS